MLTVATAIDHLVKTGFPGEITGQRIEIIDHQHVAMTEFLKPGGRAVTQLQAVIDLQRDTLPARKIGAGIEQVGFTAGRTAPEPNLDFTLAKHQRLQAVDNQFGSLRDEIIETELPVQR